MTAKLLGLTAQLLGLTAQLRGITGQLIQRERDKSNQHAIRVQSTRLCTGTVKYEELYMSGHYVLVDDR